MFSKVLTYLILYSAQDTRTTYHLIPFKIKFLNVKLLQLSLESNWLFSQKMQCSYNGSEMVLYVQTCDTMKAWKNAIPKQFENKPTYKTNTHNKSLRLICLSSN